MNTFMFNNKNIKYTCVNNIFIDKYMAKARGEYVKIYLLGLKYSMSGEIGASSDIIASKLNLLQSDILNAWNYWNAEGVIKMTALDNKGNYSIEFLDLVESNVEEESINLLQELDNNSIKEMLQDIEKFLGRPLSSKEMTMYLSWQKDFNFSPEIILLLIQYCVSKGKTDCRYIEKVAISWHDKNVRSIDDAQSVIKAREDRWVKIKKILTYLGFQNTEIMKPQEQLITKWITTYNFPLEIIYNACDICFQRINKCDFKYIDGILNSWFKDGIKSLEDIEKQRKRTSNYNKNAKTVSKGAFGNYEQRTYNFEELEKKLLGWDNND
ncbi:DnaD domain protein [Hathewaya limosa]|uniref:DnaD/phage-associated family protein n=1 Tax=Hathewaya limosa TaxID=1536 RepID=A0ABU0JNN5_HATLI|nr:DnaD domain protein [Hathewaya limosa]AWZ49713.1 DNA replication protein DnaD [Clostridiaceae bacterium 14S0207]MDQ0478702.1 DnaD/phage-associated family protein [Hathewaya limosa]